MSEQKIQAVKLKASMVAGLAPLNEIETEYAERLINDYLSKTKADYLMLLNHEVRYFTVFDNTTMVLANYGKELIKFITDYIVPVYGGLKLVDADSTTGAIEVWCGETCFILFDYSKGVVQL